MRLTSLALGNYGPFHAHRVDFDPAPGRINLLIAPNGAGKSVLRGAFADLLFGIHPQSEMGFRFGYTGMRLLAEAVTADGTTFAFGRRKGMGNTLIGADGTPLDQATLARVIGGTDKAMLERLFALDTQLLRDGGKQLLSSGGAVADALLSAAGGLRQARQIRASLDTQRDALAPERRVPARPFYQALDRVLDARRRIDATLLRPDTREKQQTEFAHLRAELYQCETAARAASSRIAQLERVRRVAGPLRQHDDAAAWLAASPDAPTLPPDTGARLAKADEAARRAELLVARERQALHEATERAASVVCDAVLLDAGEAIDALVTRAGAAAQAGRDIPKREAELSREEQTIAALLRDLGVALPIGQAAQAIPPGAAVTQARLLFTEHEKLRADLARLPDERDAALRDIAATEESLARLPPAEEFSALVREVREIRRAGDPAQRAQEAAQTVTERDAPLAAALAKLPVWRERFAAMPVQPVAAYERLDAAGVQAATAVETAMAALARLHQDVAKETSRRQELARTGVLPDEAAIATARRRRDGGWRLIFRRAFTPEAPSADEDAVWAGDVPLPLAYERAVAGADELADRRNAEADRIAKNEEIGRRLATLQLAVTDAETARIAAAARCDAAQEAWRAALQPLDLAADTGLAELRALIAGRDKAIDAQSQRDAAAAALAALQARHAASAQLLAEALDMSGGDLPRLLALAEQRIEDAKTTGASRTRLRDRLQAQRKTDAEKSAALQRASGGLQALLDDWTKLRVALHRPEGEAPSTTVALLDEFAKLDAATQAAATLRLRLHEMHDEVAQLRADAAAVAGRVAPDLAQPDALATVDALRRHLEQQRGLAKQRAELLAQQKRAEASLAAERKKASQCAIELRAVLDSIGADGVVTAEPLVARAAERAEKAETVRGREKELAGIGDGHTLDALRDQLSHFQADATQDVIDAAGEERDRCWQDVKRLTERLAADQATMQAQAAEIATVQAEADWQAAIATIGRVLDEALALHLAGLILQDALGAVDAAGTSTLLARIGALFGTLTDGAYIRIVAEDEAGGARLLAVERDFPDEAKPVAALSDGTRDQLFLALRLAAIEDHVAAAAPLPFIADDILQTFDDARALAAMRALVALSAHVQVILLSHHAHLLALADALPPEQVHVCAIAAA